MAAGGELAACAVRNSGVRGVGRGALLLVGACGRDDYVAGDWEIAVDSLLPADAETLRICVEGAPTTEVGAGNGRAAVPSLPPTDTRVRIEVNDAAGAQVMVTEWTAVGDDTPVVEARVGTVDNEACRDSGDFAGAGEDARLLVVRFVEDGP
jgi:hypothetical protein